MKKTMRRLLCLVMALCLVLSLTPIALAVDGTADPKGTALKAALAAGGTIKLDSDITVTEALTVSKDTVLDLNGHTLSVNHMGIQNYAVLVSAFLTVLDTDPTGGGKITSSTSNTLFLDYDNGDKPNSLTLESGTVENTCKGMGDSAIVSIGRTLSSVTIKGGTVWSDDGNAVVAQSPVTITGGFFHGELYFFMHGPEDGVSITGGWYDRDPGAEYDFYGLPYEAVQDGTNSDYPYKVQAIPGAELVTVSYAFDNPNLSKNQDVFRKNTEIAMPEAPDADGYVFVGWYLIDGNGKNDPLTFPYKIESDTTFHAKYVRESHIPNDFFDDTKPLEKLVVGDKVMVENGIIKEETVHSVGSDTGTATVWYDEVDKVYTLTLDTFVYEGTGYALQMADESTSYVGIYAQGNLQILLRGESEFALSDNGTILCLCVGGGSLAVADDETASGTGSLHVNVDGNGNALMAVGVYVDGGDLFVSDCELETEVDNSRMAVAIAAGLNAAVTGNLVFDGAKVTASTVNATMAAGIAASGNLKLTGGSDVTMDTKDAAASTGVQCGSLTVEKLSKLNSHGGEAASTSCAIAAETVVIQSGTVQATGSKARLRSVGLEATDVTVGAYGGLVAGGGEVASGESYGVKADDIAVEGWLVTTGGEITGKGHSYGAKANTIAVEDEGELLATGGKVASGISCGALAEGDVTVMGGTLAGTGGEVASGQSAGIYSHGSISASDDSYVEGEGGAVTAGESVGVCAEAITVAGESKLDAAGGNAGGDVGASYGVYAGGNVTVKDGSQLTVSSTEGATLGIGIKFYRSGDLTLEGKSLVQVHTDDAINQSIAISGVDGNDLTVPTGCTLIAHSGNASYGSAAIAFFDTITTGGLISASAGKADRWSVGILMNNENGNAITLEKGELGASGQTAAIWSTKDLINFQSVTVIAPQIEYSAYYDGRDTTPVETVVGQNAALSANEGQKHILALASGEIRSLSLSGITTTLSYGSPVQFTAKAVPQSIVKVEEERWDRTSDGLTISSKNPTAPDAGTYRYELVLVPAEGFSFTDDEEGVIVWYNDDDYWFTPKDGKLILSNEEANEVFVPNVTVEAPYVPPVSCTLTFEVNGGSALEALTLTPGTEVDLSAYTPEKENHVFGGWFAEAELKTPLESVTVEQDAAVYAKWIPGATVTVLEADHGTVTADAQIAEAGDTVTLTAKPAKGYLLDSLTVRDAEKKEVELTLEEDGTFTFTMSASAVTVRAVFVAASKRPFTDVPLGKWFYSPVYYCYDNGLFAGTTETTFGPKETMTRAMFATVLYRLAGQPEVAAKSIFTDVPVSKYYAKAVTWAVEKNILAGYGKGLFGAKDPVTREQIVTVLWRYNGRPIVHGVDLSAYKDAGQISSWARSAFEWAISAGIISGKGNGVLDPQGKATRAEVATIIQYYDTLIL